MKKIKLILPIIILLCLTLTACSVDQGNDIVTDTAGQSTGVDSVDTNKQVPSGEPTKQNNQATSFQDVTLKFSDAYNIYIKKFPDTKVDKVELDKDDGVYVYKVEGYDATKEYEIKIHPVSGQILKEDIDTDDRNQGNLTIEHAEKVEGMVSTALKEAGENAVIKEITLKNEDGRVEVEIEIDKKGLDDVEYKYEL